MQTGSAWNAYDSINQRCKAAEAEVDNKELELQKLRAEKEKLRSENLKLKQAVSTLGEHQEILQNQLAAKEEELLLAKNKNDVEETVAEHTHSSTKIEELLNSKLDQAVQNLKESVFKHVQTNNKQINDKLNQVLTQNRTYAESLSKIQSSGGTIGNISSTPEADLRSIMEHQKNQQLVEENDQKARSCNIIIHGVVVSTSENNNDAKISDEGFFTSLLETIGVAVTVESVSRIGKLDRAKKDQSKYIWVAR